MIGWIRRHAKIVAPVGILLLGVLILALFIASRKRPEREQRRNLGALVDVMRTERVDAQVVVGGTGTVTPRHEVTLQPQVQGRVEWVHPRLLSGGTFSRGDTLIRIERADYELAVRQARANVAQARYQLDLARANAGIARREWDMVQRRREALGTADSLAKPDALVLHEPQLQQAEAGMASAEAALEQAKLNLSRTAVTAPFDSRVRRKSVSPGQLAGPSTPIATLYATDLVEIEVGLQVEDVAWIPIPGAEAVVRLDVDGRAYEWQGVVDRRVGVIGELGRLARVVVRVDDPGSVPDATWPELAIGSFVEVEIAGRTAENVVPIPRRALREGRTVWVASRDSTLDVRDVSVKRMTDREAFISHGLDADEWVVLSNLAGAAPGMKLRPRPRGEAGE